MPKIQHLVMCLGFPSRQRKRLPIKGQPRKKRIGSVERLPPAISHLIVNAREIDGGELVFCMLLQRAAHAEISIAD